MVRLYQVTNNTTHNNKQYTRDKMQTITKKQIIISKKGGNMPTEKRIFDLEDRTTQFAVEIVKFLRTLKIDAVNTRIISQLVGSSGSIGANYREANDALGKKDFIVRAKTARKESKEAIHWLLILEVAHPERSAEIRTFMTEAIELRNILSSIISKV